MPTRNPNINRVGPNASLAHIEKNFAAIEMWGTGKVNIMSAVMSAVGQGTSEAVRRVNAIAKGMDELNVSSKSKLAQVHTGLAIKMQEATVTAYRTHPKRSNPSYRQGQDRYSGGALLAALQDPLFARGSHTGIGFANTALLDREARHWKRLNFGAKGKNQGTIAGPRRMTWDGVLIAEIDLGVSEPRPGFKLPVGVWTGPGGSPREAAGESNSGEFYPQGGQGGEGQRHLLSGKGIMGRPDNARITKGIRAWNFLDAGVQSLAREFGPAYDNLYAGWFASAQKNAGPLKGQVNLPRPKMTPYRSPR